MADKHAYSASNSWGPARMYSVAEFHAPARSSIRGHGHPHWHILFLRDGGFEEAHGDHAFHMTPETLRVSPDGAIHNIDFCEQGAQCVNIHIHDRRLIRRLRILTQDRTGIYQHTGVKTLFSRAVHQSMHPESLPVSMLTLQEGIALLSRRHGAVGGHRPPDWLEEIDRQIRDRSVAMPRIFELAARYGLSREHITRTYARYLGASPAFARSQIVLGEALHRILRTDAPYADIAAEFGYHDQSHLTHAVRKAVGDTPHALRRKRQITDLQDSL